MNKKENKKRCHPGNFLSGISALFKNNRKAEVLSKDISGRQNWESAFTLIELLVVVLIIGILAAIALPQYRKAVIKSHYAELQILARSVLQAEQLYYLANNSYTTTFSDLGIDISGASKTTTSSQYFKNNLCSLNADYISCKNNDINMAYRMDFTGERACVAYDADKTSPAHQLCKAETGLSGPSEGYSSTYFYP